MTHRGPFQPLLFCDSVGYISSMAAGAWLFCPKAYNVVPVMSVKAALVGTNYYLSGRVG